MRVKLRGLLTHAPGFDHGLHHPLVQCLARQPDLGRDRLDHRSRTARWRTSEENLFVVLLMVAPSRELESAPNSGRFTSANRKSTTAFD
jgi:hypothetical protein